MLSVVYPDYAASNGRMTDEWQIFKELEKKTVLGLVDALRRNLSGET
jgi:hypothetical protein